jgi:desumoylating isopeptidase 1
VPALDTVLEKLVSFINAIEDAPQVKEVLTEVIFPYLKVRFSAVISSSSTSATPELLNKWSHITSTLVDILPVSSLFPLVDMWRLAILDPAVAIFLSDATNIPDPISILLDKASSILSQASLNPPNFIVTLLRLLSNGFSSPQFAQRIANDTRKNLTALLIPTLLCKDSGVRKAAASLAFNLSAWVQKKRGEPAIIGSNAQMGGSRQIDGDWEVEIVTALVEAIDRENENEDISDHLFYSCFILLNDIYTVHRLTASLAFLLRLSPFYQTQLCPVLDVLQARAILNSKQHVIHRNEVKKLVEEVSAKLCP